MLLNHNNSEGFQAACNSLPRQCSRSRMVPIYFINMFLTFKTSWAREWCRALLLMRILLPERSHEDNVHGRVGNDYYHNFNQEMLLHKVNWLPEHLHRAGPAFCTFFPLILFLENNLEILGMMSELASCLKILMLWLEPFLLNFVLMKIVQQSHNLIFPSAW